MICGVAAVPGKQEGKAERYCPVICGRILGFRVPMVLVVCIIVPALRQRIVIVLFCIEKRVLSPCSLDLLDQRNLIF
jgi:hypothetical protein